MARVLVLCYHAVGEWPHEMAVPLPTLRRQVTRLLDRGYRPTTFTEAVTRRPRRDTLVVTIDDAFRSTYTRALPLLTELGVPATAFVPTTFVSDRRPLRWPGFDSAGFPPEELQPLSWAETRQLLEAGWEVGSHTRTHPRLPELDDAALRDELGGSREECAARLGVPVHSLAYPFGLADARVVQATRSAGYRAAAVLAPVAGPDRRLVVPRVSAYPGQSDLVFRVKQWRWWATSAGAAAVRATRLVAQQATAARARGRLPAAR